MTSSQTATVIRPLRFETPPEAEALPPYQPAGSHDRPDIDFDPQLERAIRRHIARQISREWQAMRPHRLLVIQGPGGGGKSEAVKVVASRAGTDLTFIAAGMIGGEGENSGVGVLHHYLLGSTAIARVTGRPHLICVDDADLSIFVTREDREYQVDTDNTTGFLQHVADNRGEYTDASGAPIGLIFTGNDFRGLRETLKQRAVFYTHAPTWRETAARLERLAAPTSAFARRALWRLVSKYRKQPLRFFVEVLAATAEVAVEPVLDGSPLDVAAIDQAIAATRQGPLDVRAMFSIARARAAVVPTSFIPQWR